MSQTTHSLCPVVRDETLKLWERVEVGGAWRLLPFDQRVLWLRESHTQIVMRYRGIVINEMGTMNDFYGFLTSLKGAITDDIAAAAKRLSLGAGEALTIDADVKIEDIPVLPDESDEGRGHNAKWPRKQYLYARSANDKRWFTSDRPISDEKYAPYPVLEPRVVETVEKIYSTGRHKIGSIPREVTGWIDKEIAHANAGVQ